MAEDQIHLVATFTRWTLYPCEGIHVGSHHTQDCDGRMTDSEEQCNACEGAGQVMKKVRKEVSEFDDLTEEEQQAMLDAALETARNNVDCPV